MIEGMIKGGFILLMSGMILMFAGMVIDLIWGSF